MRQVSGIINTLKYDLYDTIASHYWGVNEESPPFYHSFYNMFIFVADWCDKVADSYELSDT